VLSFRASPLAIRYHPAVIGGAKSTGWALLAACLSCVPEGPPTEGDPPPKRAISSKHPEKAPFDLSADPQLSDRFSDNFERKTLGPDWRALAEPWHIVRGELCGKGAKNRGVWLRRRMPTNARIEFDARTASTHGDIKVEAWGDGRSGATKASYTDATSYLMVFGGWKNSRHVLARINEHGDDRLSLEVDPASDDPRQRAVEPGQVYRFAIERSDGRTVRWWVDDLLMAELEDDEPLTGEGHDHFGFNDWDVALCFDNLSITPL
jgi:hypothetical protein